MFGISFDFRISPTGKSCEMGKRKQTRGCAAFSLQSKIWFTLQGGSVTEVCCPAAETDK